MTPSVSYNTHTLTRFHTESTVPDVAEIAGRPAAQRQVPQFQEYKSTDGNRILGGLANGSVIFELPSQVWFLVRCQSPPYSAVQKHHLHHLLGYNPTNIQ